MTGYRFLAIISAVVVLSACNRGEKAVFYDTVPSISPDYSGITIPVNIAPLNFRINGNGTAYFTEISGGEEPSIRIRIRSGTGIIRIPEKKWKKLLSASVNNDIQFDISIRDEKGLWKRYRTFTNRIAPEPVDPYLSYRLLYPGYESWNELSIEQRDLATFRERPIINNRVADDNCVNCHSYNNGRTDDFLFHMRGSVGGTYFYTGTELKKTNLKTPEMKNGAVYPRWHPSGKYVAFSSNKVVQQFHASDNKKVEVSDMESSLVVYDIEKNEMIPLDFPGHEKYMDTYPEWSPDGKILYFCRAAQIGDVYDYQQIRYNLFKASFDTESGSYGDPQLVFDAAAISKSISFPRISSDGKYLVMTMQDYGCFPIWHKETDLFSLRLDSLQIRRLELNSDSTESYHSWSSNGRWLVFSSKRGDGLTARPYISYIDEEGYSSKPFILPQKDPGFYDNFMKTYNVPEFSLMRVKLNPGTIRAKSREEAMQTEWQGGEK